MTPRAADATLSAPGKVERVLYVCCSRALCKCKCFVAKENRHGLGGGGVRELQDTTDYRKSEL